MMNQALRSKFTTRHTPTTTKAKHFISNTTESQTIAKIKD